MNQPSLQYLPSIVSYVITMRRSTSEHFLIISWPYICTIVSQSVTIHGMMYQKIHPTSQHLDDSMPGKGFKVHINVSIETKLCMFKIRMYNLKHFSETFHIARARSESVVHSQTSVNRILPIFFSVQPLFNSNLTKILSFAVRC